MVKPAAADEKGWLPGVEQTGGDSHTAGTGRRSVITGGLVEASCGRGGKLDQGRTPVESPDQIPPEEGDRMPGKSGHTGEDQSQTSPADPSPDVLQGITVRMIDDGSAPPGMIRAAVKLAVPDAVGVLDDLNGILREHNAKRYSAYGTRLDDVAALCLLVVVPEAKAQALVESTNRLRTDHMPASGLRTSQRRKMRLIRLDLSHPEDDGESADELPRILRKNEINIRTMTTESYPVPKAGGGWDGPRATSIGLTVEVDPGREQSWGRALARIRRWADDHGWSMGEPDPLN